MGHTSRQLPDGGYCAGLHQLIVQPGRMFIAFPYDPHHMAGDEYGGHQNAQSAQVQKDAVGKVHCERFSLYFFRDHTSYCLYWVEVGDIIIKKILHKLREVDQMSKSEDAKKAVKKKPQKTAKEKKQEKQEKKKNR